MTRLARALGIALQILVLGQLLSMALSEMYVAHTGARVFKYAEY